MRVYYAQNMDLLCVSRLLYILHMWLWMRLYARVKGVVVSAFVLYNMLHTRELTLKYVSPNNIMALCRAPVFHIKHKQTQTQQYNTMGRIPRLHNTHACIQKLFACVCIHYGSCEIVSTFINIYFIICGKYLYEISSFTTCGPMHLKLMSFLLNCELLN